MSQFVALTGIIITLLFILFFAGMETAFLTASRLNIELKKKQGISEGILSSRFAENPTSFIGTSVFGTILSLVFYGLFFNTYMNKILWSQFGIHNELLLLFINSVVSTIFVVFSGRFLAKLFFNRSEKLFYAFLSFFNVFYSLFHGIIKLFITFSGGILKYLFNVKIKADRQPFDRMKLEHLFQQAKDAQGNSTQDINTYLFEKALTLPNIKIRQCLVPRTEIIGVSINTPVSELQQQFLQQSKLLVYEDSIDNILGYVDERNLFDNPSFINDMLLPVFAVPESMNIVDLLTRFSKEKKSLAWVIDEFGGTAGIITIQDVLTQLFGEALNEFDKEHLIEQKISDTEYIFSGRLELEYLNDEYDLEFPEDESETLSGYIVNANKAIPTENERIIIDNYEFEILSVTDTRVDRAKMKILR
ncbi:MAG: hemolysin family protein [Arachidicoccus sp.]|nr:hemolysin family protein [Arachidicoccus sp.]